MDPIRTQHILEACLLVAGRPMNVAQLEALFEGDVERPTRDGIRDAVAALQAQYAERAIEIVEVASGWRLQSRIEVQHWVSRLFQERIPRYSRALLETLVLVAYRQPITRGEIEEVRGVAVSSSIVRTLQERQWVREVGYKDVPGKPALLGTTRQFLDYFNLKRLEDLPTLGELKDLDAFDAVLAETGLVASPTEGAAANDSGEGEGESPARGPAPGDGPENDSGDGLDGGLEGGPSGDPSGGPATGAIDGEAALVDEAEPGETDRTEAPSGVDPDPGPDLPPGIDGDVPEPEAAGGSTGTDGADGTMDAARPSAGDDDHDGDVSSSPMIPDMVLGDDSRDATVTRTSIDLPLADDAAPFDPERHRYEPSASDAPDDLPELVETIEPEGPVGVLSGQPRVIEPRSRPEPVDGPSDDDSAGADPDEPDPSPYEDPRLALLRVIDRFGAEHRQDIEGVPRGSGREARHDEETREDPARASVPAEPPDRDDRVP